MTVNDLIRHLQEWAEGQQPDIRIRSIKVDAHDQFIIRFYEP